MHKFCNTFIPVGKSCNPVDRALHMRWSQYIHLKYKQDWSYIFDLTNPRFANPQPVLCCFLPVATSCICTLATDDLHTPSSPSCCLIRLLTASLNVEQSCQWLCDAFCGSKIEVYKWLSLLQFCSSNTLLGGFLLPQHLLAKCWTPD